ncbi:hypothetical protein PIB30_047689 [Stylosanthes scabra]|uniref:Uncharacterized protein n=1 Tax=Stylosanthes scabra TaxID=79078 RepID=A0ABU6ZFL3_9FABA|nr:hypothetical protein [Stylosanthes scabra]
MSTSSLRRQVGARTYGDPHIAPPEHECCRIHMFRLCLQPFDRHSPNPSRRSRSPLMRRHVDVAGEGELVISEDLLVVHRRLGGGGTLTPHTMPSTSRARVVRQTRTAHRERYADELEEERLFDPFESLGEDSPP